MNHAKAVVVRGHGIASGSSHVDRRFPVGTIRMQLPFFKQLGLDVIEYLGNSIVMGTLNLSIAPDVYAVERPEFVMPGVAWTSLFPPETFFLSKAEIGFAQQVYRALLYMPDRATKPDHFQPADVIEVIAQRVPDLREGSEIDLGYTPDAIRITAM